MGKLILKHIESPNKAMWAYCTWKAILGIQMGMASDLKHLFKNAIEVIHTKFRTHPKICLFTFKGASDLSEGQLNKKVADEETHFLTLCRNAICALESQKILEEINSRKKAQTDKIRRDKVEFLGDALPDLSVILPRVFESQVVLVCISFKCHKVRTPSLGIL